MTNIVNHFSILIVVIYMYMGISLVNLYTCRYYLARFRVHISWQGSGKILLGKVIGTYKIT